MEDLKKLAEPESAPSGEKGTLLKKYDIPISYLDFDHVKRCANGRELEKILHILQSGEEGYFPDLIKVTEERLALIKPNSKYIRKEIPVLNKAYLEKEDFDLISHDLSEWITKVNINNEELKKIGNKNNVNIPEVRKKTNFDKEIENKLNRIKSTDYSSWEKYDPDTEILKMDLEAEKLRNEIITKSKEPGKKVKFNEFHTKAEATFEAEREKEKGNEYYKTGDYKQALLHYTNSINFAPSAANYNNRAITNIKLNKYESAIKDCKSAMKYDSNNIKALLRLSQSYEALENFEEAIIYAERVIQIEANNILAQNTVNRLNQRTNRQCNKSKKRLKIVEIDNKIDCDETNRDKLLDNIFKGENNSKIIEITETPKELSSDQYTKKIIPTKKRDHVLLSIPGPSFMPEPYFVRVENKDQSLIKRQEYILNNRQQTLYWTSIDNDDNECEIIHLKKTDSKYRYGCGNTKDLEKYDSSNKTKISNQESNSIKPVDKNSNDCLQNTITDKQEQNLIEDVEKLFESSDDVLNVKLPVHLNNIVTAEIDTNENNKMIDITLDRQDTNLYFRNGAGEPHNCNETEGFNLRPDAIDSPYVFTQFWHSVHKDLTGFSIAKLLRNINSDMLPYLIGCKLDGSMFRSILRTLYQHFSVPHEIARVKNLLTNLTNVPRFDMNLLFLSEEDKNNLKCMLQFLEQHGNPLPIHIKQRYLV